MQFTAIEALPSLVLQCVSFNDCPDKKKSALSPGSDRTKSAFSPRPVHGESGFGLGSVRVPHRFTWNKKDHREND